MEDTDGAGGIFHNDDDELVFTAYGELNWSRIVQYLLEQGLDPFDQQPCDLTGTSINLDEEGVCSSL